MIVTSGRRIRVAMSVFMSLLALPAMGYAQDASALTGVVTDTTGAALPGVTVEAASPALIEGVRTTVSDGQGLYRIIDLRPGAYTVTFTLPGFSTIRRDGLALTSGFTATVNAELRVGNVAETILVTGESPVVDLQNVRQQTTLQRETLDALPTTGRLNHLASVIPGATLGQATDQNVGGLFERGSYGVHGTRADDNVAIVAGMSQRVGAGGSATFVFNNQAFQEVTIETTGMTAERSTGGVQQVIVPKDGGNSFSGSVSTVHTFPSWQSENVTDVLRAQGLLTGKSVKSHYDSGFGIGGPIRRDRIWFFGAFRRGLSEQYQQGSFYDRNPNPLVYEPDRTRPFANNDLFRDYSVRLTWQAAAQHKVVGSLAVSPSEQFFVPSGTRIISPEAIPIVRYNPNVLPLAQWTYTPSNRMLVEAGASANIFNANTLRFEGVDTTDISVTDVGTNIVFGSLLPGATLQNAPASSYRVKFTRQYHQQAAVSYVTGSHNFKMGFSHDLYPEGIPGRHNDPNQVNQARSYTFRNGVPLSVTIWAVPYAADQRVRVTAGYVQDQWALRRLTLNLGVRLNNFNGSAPATDLPAGPFVPARSFEETKNVPNYWNLNPRLGAAYDLFGNGKTAVKVSLGRFNPFSDGRATVNVPAANQAASTNRTWGDANGDLVPDCDLRNPAANGECGPWSDLTFGQIRASNTRRAPDALEGFNREFYSWQAAASVQHELMPNVALNVGYFRTWYGGFLATDNLAVTPADFSPYCITAPRDGRLPGGGGNQLCGLYDVSPAKFGQVDNLVTLASHYGEQTEIYNGIDATLNARFGQGGLVSGGLSMGRTTTNNCFVVDSPQQARSEFCDITPPWSSGSQVKLAVVYPLPWDLQTSVIYQNIPGIAASATYVAPNAEIAPSLGRNLGACGTRVPCTATANVELVPTNVVTGVVPTSQVFNNATSTSYLDRLQQVDVRVSRAFRVGARARVQGNLDLYNLFNASNTLRLSPTYGPTWLNAAQILGGRLVKAGATVSF